MTYRRGGIEGAQMQIGQFAGTPAVAPLGGQHDEIEGMRTFDLEPARAPIAGFIGRVQRLRHETFVPGLDRGIVEGARLGFGRVTRRGTRSGAGTASASA
jgi:hypothetical protein